MPALLDLILAEATPGGQLKLGVPDRLKLQDAIYHKLVRGYEAGARKTSKQLGGDGAFKLTAAWKQRDLQTKARVMARAVTSTTRGRLAVLRELPAGEYGPAKSKFLAYKAAQLEDLVAAEAGFQAQTDMLAHSGAVSVKTARVMYFRIMGTEPPRSPCPICSGVAAGNPYTIAHATTLGAKLHPNCVDHWENRWGVDETTQASIARRVADGELTLWGGQSRTPARGRATDKRVKLQAAKGGWKGRRTQERRTITSRKAA